MSRAWPMLLLVASACAGGVFTVAEVPDASAPDGSAPEAFTSDADASDGATGIPDAPTDASGEAGDDASVRRCPSVPAAPANVCAAGSCVRSQLYAPRPESTEKVFGIAVTATHVYWVEQTVHEGGSPGRLHRMPKGGGVAEVVADAPGGRRVAVDDAHVYWTQDGLAAAKNFRLQRLPLTATCNPGCPTPEALFVPSQRQADGLLALGAGEILLVDNVTYSRQRHTPGTGWQELSNWESGTYPGAAANAEAIFTASAAQGGRIQRMPRTGSQPETWATVPVKDASLFGVNYLAADCTAVFAVSAAVGVYRIDHASPLTPRELAGSQGSVYAIEQDERFVYVGRPNSPGINRIDKESGRVVNIAVGDVWGLAVDDEYVYFGSHADGRIYRIAKAAP